eukprot:c16419_g1_i1.p1 GENE.c16419_g1_i1~~c16419_g1_i1.p1  ORF type:complete len:284 (-),score=52.33 c16419_g1_i1:164-1015(-)
MGSVKEMASVSSPASDNQIETIIRSSRSASEKSSTSKVSSTGLLGAQLDQHVCSALTLLGIKHQANIINLGSDAEADVFLPAQQGRRLSDIAPMKFGARVYQWSSESKTLENARDEDMEIAGQIFIEVKKSLAKQKTGNERVDIVAKQSQFEKLISDGLVEGYDPTKPFNVVVFFNGDDSGRSIEETCPDGTLFVWAPWSTWASWTLQIGTEQQQRLRQVEADNQRQRDDNQRQRDDNQRQRDAILKLARTLPTDQLRSMMSIMVPVLFATEVEFLAAIETPV